MSDEWTDEQIAEMHRGYLARHGAKHPERGITEEQFRFRLAEFEKLIDPWILGGGCEHGSAHKWCKSVGLPARVGLGSFWSMFAVVDAIHPVT